MYQHSALNVFFQTKHVLMAYVAYTVKPKTSVQFITLKDTQIKTNM